MAPRQARVGGTAARGAAAAPADDVRSRDDPRDRLLPRHRELRAAPDRPRAGRAAADAARLPAEGRADHRRREPSDGAADPRDVSRRPIAQGSARRLRLPPAVGARQPSAELRGMGAARRTGDFRFGDAGPLRAVEVAGRRRRADHPADRADRSADRRPSGEGAGGRPAAGDPHAGRGAASACW